ncbi:LysR substrate-binding domain-containing protein, partial [Bacillus cereus group sp. Bce013]
ARDILQLWHTTKASINEHASLLGGKLTLFCSVTASYSHLPELLARFRQQYPNIELQLLTGDPAQAEEKVQDNSADIAIAAKPKRLSSS